MGVKQILKLREENILEVLEDRELRRIYRTKMEEMAGEDWTMRSFVTCTLHQILQGWLNHTILQLEKLKRRDNSEDLEVDGNITLEWILGK